MFLIPFAIVVVILGKVHRVMAKLLAPLAGLLPLDTIVGFAEADLLAVIAIVIVCFVAGLMSKSRLASRLVESLESGLLQFVPGYIFIKGLTGGLAGDNEENQMAPVLARFDDSWQVAFRVEQLADRRVVLFIPGAPNTWSGSLVIMDEERIQPLTQTMASAIRNLSSLGRGSDELLSEADVNAKSKTRG